MGNMSTNVFLRFNKSHVKNRWIYVSLRLTTWLEMLLQKQVIRCCDIIMVVGIKTSNELVGVDIMTFKLFNNRLIDWHLIIPNNHTWGNREWPLIQIEPFMLFYIIKSVSFLWINVQYFFQKISRILRHMWWNTIFSFKNFII